jgi:hypothetical protein
MDSCTGQESAHGNQLLRIRRPYGDFAAAVGLGKEKIAQIERLRYTSLVCRSMMSGCECFDAHRMVAGTRGP